MSQETRIVAAPGVPFLDVVRDFEAPVEAVYRCHVEPDLFAQWMGPRDMRMDRVELDAVSGGRWLYEFRAGGGELPMRFSGFYHTVEPNALLIQTFEFNLAPDDVGISTSRFDDLGGRTRLTMHEVYSSVESRDAAVANGMEYGIVEGFVRLDELLAR